MGGTEKFRNPGEIRRAFRKKEKRATVAKPLLFSSFWGRNQKSIRSANCMMRGVP